MISPRQSSAPIVIDRAVLRAWRRQAARRARSALTGRTSATRSEGPASATGTIGCGTRRLRRSLVLGLSREPHSTKLFEDCVGWGGRDKPGDADRGPVRAAARARGKKKKEAALAPPRRPRKMGGGSPTTPAARRSRSAGAARSSWSTAGGRASTCGANPHVQPARARVRGAGCGERCRPQPAESRAAYPDEEGFRRARRRAPLYEVYGSGRARRVCLLPTWALIHWRAAGKCRSRFWPGTPIVTPTGAGTAAPTTVRRRGIRDPRIRSGHARGDGRDGDGTRSRRRRVVRGALASVPAPRSIRSASPAPRFSSGRPSLWRQFCKTHILSLRRAARYRRRVGEVQHAPLAAGLSGTSSEFFVGKCFPEPHSTKPIEDAVGWALWTTPEVLAGDNTASTCRSAAKFRELCGRGRCPSIILHGDEDALHSACAGRGARGSDGRAAVTLEGGSGDRGIRGINLRVREGGARLGDRRARHARADAGPRPGRRPGYADPGRRPGFYWERLRRRRALRCCCYRRGRSSMPRLWKAADPRTSRVTSACFTFDGRGNGRSDRPAGRWRPTRQTEFAADAFGGHGHDPGTASAALVACSLRGRCGLTIHGRLQAPSEASSGSRTSGPRSPLCCPITSCVGYLISFRAT